MEKRTQDIYNADILSDILGKTVITRTFEEVSCKDMLGAEKNPIPTVLQCLLERPPFCKAGV